MGKILETLMEKHNLNEEQQHFVRAIEEGIDNYDSQRKAELTSMVEKVRADFPADAINSLRQEIETLKANKEENYKGLRAALQENFAEIKKAQTEKRDFSFVVPTSKRAAALMTVANVLSSDLKKHYAVDAGWDEIRYPENFIVDVIGGREVAEVPPILKKKLEKVVEGNATLVAPSGLKPLMSTDFDVTFFERVKYAGRFEIEEEIKAFDELYQNIIEVIEKQVIRDYKAGTFTWVTSQAVAYAGSILDGTMVKPTMGAVVSAVALQIASLNYTPNVAYMNIADIEAAKWVQADNGMFLMPPSDTLGSSLRVYADNSIPQGKILVGDTSTINEMHSPLIVRFGGYTSTAHFENNQEAAVVEIFSLPYLVSRNAASWVYADIAVVLAALQAPATPAFHYTLAVESMTPTATSVAIEASADKSVLTADLVEIQVSDTNTFDNVMTSSVMMSGDGKTITSTVSGLTTATTYYTRVKVMHDGTTDYSSTDTFTTL